MRVHTGDFDVRIILVTTLLGLSGCTGLYFGDNPRRDVARENGPLTMPPPLPKPSDP